MVKLLSDSTEVNDRNAKRSIVQEQSVENYLIICQRTRTIIETSGAELVEIDLSKAWEISLHEKCQIQIESQQLFDA